MPLLSIESPRPARASSALEQREERLADVTVDSGVPGLRLIAGTPSVLGGTRLVAVYRRLQRAVAGRAVAARLAEAFGGRAFEIGSAMDKVTTFLTLVDDEAPELVDPFRMLLRASST